jgi:L-threonylcarbamoyladenylate synthase
MGCQISKQVDFKTQILPVKRASLGQFKDRSTLETWELSADEESLQPLREAAKHLRESNIPVGFPTETVYGLGADATRSDAVKGIYKAKGRPSDNPLIIHVCDLTMLQNLLVPAGTTASPAVDLIPAIYKPLIARFWPGPLTILLSNPQPSKLAPEVTAGLPTFGARMPDSPLALSLINLAGVPLAAPSANASTKPSPTTAEHVRYDLNGKIKFILDGGACQVGVESTVVDGMCDPPVVLRPGGVSIDEIRKCEGWANVVKGYKDQSEIGAAAPRAPGMKYKHYSPKAKVVLYEASAATQDGSNPSSISQEIWKALHAQQNSVQYLGLELLSRPVSVGIVSTKNWRSWAGFQRAQMKDHAVFETAYKFEEKDLGSAHSFAMRQGQLWAVENSKETHIANVTEISLGSETKDIAHGLFSALRELDQRGVDVIYAEGIDDEGDIAAAVMNRLRKAATVIEK